MFLDFSYLNFNRQKTIKKSSSLPLMYDHQYVKKICTKMVDTEKPIKKTEIKNLDINRLIISININENLRITGRILVGLVRIYIKKLKYLVDESNELLVIISNKKQKIRTHKKEVQAMDEDVYISDIIVHDDVHENRIETSDMMNFDDMSIESMRDIEGNSTVGNTLVDSFKINIERKRRKISEDDVIEYDNQFYKDNVCNIKNNLDRPDKFNLNCLLEYKVPKFFMDKLNMNKEVEIMRDQTSLDHYNEISLADDYVPESFYTESEDIIIEDKELDLETLPSEFDFNIYVSNFDKDDKAKYFFNLLIKASEGSISVKQNSPTSNILCKIN
jgi:hypothetical protein